MRTDVILLNLELNMQHTAETREHNRCINQLETREAAERRQQEEVQKQRRQEQQQHQQRKNSKKIPVFTDFLHRIPIPVSCPYRKFTIIRKIRL